MMVNDGRIPRFFFFIVVEAESRKAKKLLEQTRDTNAATFQLNCDEG